MKDKNGTDRNIWRDIVTVVAERKFEIVTGSGLFFYFRVPLSFPAETDKKMNSDNDIWDLRLRYFE